MQQCVVNQTAPNRAQQPLEVTFLAACSGSCYVDLEFRKPCRIQRLLAIDVDFQPAQRQRSRSQVLCRVVARASGQRSQQNLRRRHACVGTACDRRLIAKDLMTTGGNQEFHVACMLCDDFHKMTPLMRMQPNAKGDRLVEMRIQDKVVVVTGGAHGIGRALCMRFAQEGARAVVVADLDGAAAADLAGELRASGASALALEADVSNEPQVRGLARDACNAFGRIDLYCSNAGISILGGEETPDAEWDRIFAVNVRSHIYAARAVLPGMLERGEGYLLQTISAAGLLTMPGSAPYSVTKHAALAFAEWLAITYGRRGIRVSALCPQGVRTGMLRDAETLGFQFLLDTAIEPRQVAEAAVRGLLAEKFLILPHPEVAGYFRHKATDYDRWIAGMQKLH